MATTLVAFIMVRLTFTSWLRPRLVAPAHQVLALNPRSTGYGSTNNGPLTLFPESPNTPNAWIYSTQIVDKAGHVLNPQFVARDCPSLRSGLAAAPPPPGHAVRVPAPAGTVAALHDCVVKIGATYHDLVTYQPANRYWAFQTYELAVFLGAALILTGFSFWWVRRRLA